MKVAKLFSTGILLLCQFIFHTSFAQQGKDGAGNILVANTIVNVYTSLTVNAGVGATSISVASAAGFAAGDLVYLIQMQGATVNAYVDQFGNWDNALPNDTSFGKVSAYNGSGNNEFAEVSSVLGNVITIDCGLRDSFGVNGKTQVIRVPRYTSLTITSPGTITSPLWDGTTGGVVVIEVQGNTTINAGASINVAGKGFRGGGVFSAVGYGATNTGSNYDLTGVQNNGGHKGESIVGDTTYYKTIHAVISFTNISMPLTLCKANVANGGGGGNSMNCGGGGGSNGGTISAWNGMGNPDNSTANNVTSWGREPLAPVSGSFRPTVSSGGGRGGYAFSQNNNITADPIVTGPNNSGVWGGDSRHNDGGWGGIPLDYSGGKIFLGGGAGAGDSNDGNGTSGGNGGGIVYLMSYGTVTGAGQIITDGATALNTNWVPGNTWNESPANGDDGAGGGGGGGAVFVNSVGAITLTNATPISAIGGVGGNYAIKNVVSTTKNFGPGGGGGGGYVATSNAVVNSVLGGNNGIVVSGSGNNTRIATKFPPNGATRGGAGGSGTVTNFFLTTTNYTICAGSSASLSVTIGGTPPGGISVNWYNLVIGGAIIFTGNPYNTGALTVGTYTFYAGTCPGTYRIPVIVTVLNAPVVTAAATPTVICAGQSTVLTGSGASTYTWSANAGSATTSTVSVSPVITTTYTVTGANGTCTSSQTVAVNVTASPTVVVAASNTTICSGTPVTFTASGATTYTWSANAGSATTATVSVSPGGNTTYTVTGDNGTCTNTQTISVNVNTTPTVAIVASNTTVCSGTPITFTASGATTYTWSANAGSATTSTVSVSPGSNTTYTVTGDNGGCIATQTISVNVSTSPTVTAVASNTTICSGTAVTFTASGATTYTWSANLGSATTATVSVSPTASDTYTVTGDNSGCIATQTISVNVTTTPTVTATSNTVICNGSSVTFTASGATTYTWSANAGSVTTATASVSPNANTTYTVTGDNSGCTATQTVSVVVNMPPTKADSVANAASCNQSNGSYVLNSVTGGTGPYQINFNGTGFTPVTFTYTVPGLSAGIYSVVIQDNNGCTYNSSINITNSNGITKIDSVITKASCNPSNNGLVLITSITGGTGPYQISVNGGGFTPMVLPDSLLNLTAGTYTVVIQDNTGCLHPTLITVGTVAGITQVDTVTKDAICIPSNSGAIAINAVTGGVGPYQVSLNGGAFTTIASFPDSLLNLTAGNYTLVVQDANGCTNTTTVTVGSNGGISAATNATVSDTCNKSVGTFSVTSVTGGVPAYQYSLNGGAFQSSAVFTGLGAGNYTVTVQDINGCTFTLSDSVKLAGAIPSPTVTASGLTTFCQGDSVTLTSSSVTGNTWSTSATTQTITVSAAGTYSLSILQSGCIVNSNTIAVTVNPTPTITVNSASICDGSSTTLTSSGASTYTWSPTTGLSSSTGTSVTANPTVTTAYTISATDVNGCTSSSTSTVVVSPTPLAPTVNPDTLYYCLYQSAPVLTTTVTGGATLTWYDASGNVLTAAPTPSTTILGTTTYYVSQGIGACESGKDSIKIIVVQGPNAIFTTNPPINTALPGQAIVFTPAQQYAYYNYLWNFGDPSSGSNSSSAIIPSHTYNVSGAYCTQLIITSSQTGCKDSSTLCYDMINGIIIEIPNVFSPNGDNINDVFSVKAEGISKLTCEIYDRWGLKLYVWDGVTGHWDGNTTSGKTCSDGTYYYVIDATDVRGKSLKYNGHLQLLK